MEGTSLGKRLGRKDGFPEGSTLSEGPIEGSSVKVGSLLRVGSALGAELADGFSLGTLLMEGFPLGAALIDGMVLGSVLIVGTLLSCWEGDSDGIFEGMIEMDGSKDGMLSISSMSVLKKEASAMASWCRGSRRLVRTKSCSSSEISSTLIKFTLCTTQSFPARSQLETLSPSSCIGSAATRVDKDPAVIKSTKRMDIMVEDFCVFISIDSKKETLFRT